MLKKADAKMARRRRHARVRRTVRGLAGRPRLSVFRSLNHIYAQIVDDAQGVTLAAASSRDSDLRETAKGKKKAEVSALVGEAIARRAKDKGITQVVFDRGGYLYHGRVKALADGARRAGLQF
jgi:large subunit ribosomal protein L18